MGCASQPAEASLFIESFLPGKVVCPARQCGWESAVILACRSYAEKLAAAMEVRSARWVQCLGNINDALPWVGRAPASSPRSFRGLNV